jgi:hypothetical protein
MPRFAILRHEMPATSSRATHWDLLLERGETLETWALSQEPVVGAWPIEIEVEALPDHRLDYLTYEGPVSGHRGTVSRWDEGEFSENERGGVTLRGANLTCHVEFLKRDQRWIARLTPLDASTSPASATRGAT